MSDDEKNANLELGECDLKEEKATPGSLGYIIIIIIYDPRNLEHHLLYHGLLVDPNSQVLQDSVEQKIYMSGCKMLLRKNTV